MKIEKNALVINLKKDLIYTDSNELFCICYQDLKDKIQNLLSSDSRICNVIIVNNNEINKNIIKDLIEFCKSLNLKIFLFDHISIFKDIDYFIEFIDGVILKMNYVNDKLFYHYNETLKHCIKNELKVYVYSEINNSNLNSKFSLIIKNKNNNFDNWFVEFKDLKDCDKLSFKNNYKNINNFNIIDDINDYSYFL